MVTFWTQYSLYIYFIHNWCYNY